MLDFQIVNFLSLKKDIRHMLVRRIDNYPMLSASIYEEHLFSKSDSHNTRYKSLLNFAYLYSWASFNDIDLDKLLLNGVGLTLPQVRAFSSWLRDATTKSNGLLSTSQRKSLNAVTNSCSRICVWFMQHFSLIGGHQIQRLIELELLIQSQIRSWKEVTLKVRELKKAPDLGDKEISIIEKFLHPANRSKSVGESIAARDYLIWRMAIEFGMRKGEILAIRIQDCPSLNQPYFKIVRIEDREEFYLDPRTSPPRPKTLSRDLGYVLQNTVFPKIVSEYVSLYRYSKVCRYGKKSIQWVFPHDFLIISHKGKPLSIRAADDIAKAIREGTGLKFNWHLARHAFFNRAYAELKNTCVEDFAAMKSDLILWGGWQSEKSLDIYIRKARFDQSRNPLWKWQKGDKDWTALN